MREKTKTRLAVLEKAFGTALVDRANQIEAAALQALDNLTLNLLAQFLGRGVPVEEATQEEKPALIRAGVEYEKATAAWETNRRQDARRGSFESAEAFARPYRTTPRGVRERRLSG